MNKFSATEPSLGYHYQVRYALYLLLKTRDKEDYFVRLENLDDVEIADVNKIELHQTKFHNKKAANLTDSSVDIWKTIRVWSEMAIEDKIDLDNVLLVLVTTSKASKDSIVKKLTESEKRDKTINEVIKKFDVVSQNSKSETLKKSFEAYGKLADNQKKKLVKSIHVRDNALSFDKLKKEIKKELQLTCLPEQIESVFEGLQGWWYEKCIQQLQGFIDAIYFDETRKYIVYLNDKFKFDNLPIDKIIKQADIDETSYDNRVFVNQLLEIGIGRNTLRQAKRDLYRAGEQRSKWLREELLHPEEEIEYDFKLKDDWNRKFAFLQDDIEERVDNEAKKMICKNFYKKFYVDNHPQIFIRPRVTEPFIVTGSCHLLADKQDMVWHPKYFKNK